jgi:hypothetical protein
VESGSRLDAGTETADQGGKDVNAAEQFVANVDDTTAHFIKITVRQDGSFTVTNPRNGFSKPYLARTKGD